MAPALVTVALMAPLTYKSCPKKENPKENEREPSQKWMNEWNDRNPYKYLIIIIAFHCDIWLISDRLPRQSARASSRARKQAISKM